ncbi:tetratricopeptide repeat protein [Methyloglobulus sp.]|uniref:tetratricopeptide repeat protein n=1 Tax=Methyloglobulus sp. TaxID=2518622 RepID=UPI001857BCB2|nr:sel1 repeat family protein [Methyloglobulus sp.]
MTESKNLSISELQQQATAGDTQAQFALGLYYSTKIEEDLSFERAEGWEFKGKLFGDWLADDLDIETDIDPKILSAFDAAKDNQELNDETAFNWFKQAADKDHIMSQYAVARCYYEGKGTEQSDSLAFRWAEKASHQEFGEAFGLLGDLYREGRGVEQDDKSALGCYEKAANAGVNSARSKRIKMLLTNKGISDYSKYRSEIDKIIENIEKKFESNIDDFHQYMSENYPILPHGIEDYEEELSEKYIGQQRKLFQILVQRCNYFRSAEDDANQLNKLSQENESLKIKMQKLVEQFTHTLGNVIFPDTIYQVAERLKNNPDCRKDVLLLHEAYHSEIIIKLQGELLRQRYANTNPEKFRQLIRSCRRTSNSSDKTKTIEDILDYAVSRVTARFLNQHYAGLNSIRDKILVKLNVSLDVLKQKFEDDILLNKSMKPIEWVSQNLRPIQVAQVDPLWNKVFILSESHAEALLFGYFSEILFNAFKYADHDKDAFLTLDFAETTLNDKTYLTCSWENPVQQKPPTMLGTGKGLDAIQEDLKQLDDTVSPAKSLLISQQSDQFKVTLFIKQDLLYKELTSPEDLNLFL